jgi:hypothetical protein
MFILVQDWEICYFQWIDATKMVDRIILLSRKMGKKLYDKYKRWVPPPPNPPPMTDEENKIAIATHMARDGNGDPIPDSPRGIPPLGDGDGSILMPAGN